MEFVIEINYSNQTVIETSYWNQSIIEVIETTGLLKRFRQGGSLLNDKVAQVKFSS